MKKISCVVLIILSMLLCACNISNGKTDYYDFPLKDNGYPNWDNLIIDDEIYDLETNSDDLSKSKDINYKIDNDRDTIRIVIPKRMPIVNWVAEYDAELFSLTESTIQSNLRTNEPVEGESGELQKFIFKYNSEVEAANIKLLLRNVDTADDIIYSITIHISK